MPQRFRFLLILCLALGIPGAATCRAQHVNDHGLWFAYFGNGDAGELEFQDKQIKWWFDTHLRYLDDAGGYTQSIIRPGAGIETGEDMALWAGYAYIHTQPVAGEGFGENRIWQQWTWAPSDGDMSYLVRSRFEQRFIEESDDIGLRWRQMFRAAKKLKSNPAFTLVAWDEIFFHLNNTDFGARTGLNQNRAFVGVGYQKPGSGLRTEIGYLNQSINLPGGANHRTNHILSVNFFY